MTTAVIAGTINMFVRSGWKVHVVWLTSAGMGEGSIWGSVEERRAQMEKVADKQGIPPNHRHVPGITGRECVHHLPEIVDMVTGLVIEYQPSVIVTLAYEGGHWDHDASCLAAAVAAKRADFPIARFEVPTYNTSGPRFMPYRINGFIKAYGPFHFVVPDAKAREARRRVRYGYQNQWFLMLPEGILGGYRRLAGKGEPIRKTPDYDFLSPPHPEPLMVQRKVVGALPGAPFSWWEQGVRSIP